MNVTEIVIASGIATETATAIATATGKLHLHLSIRARRPLNSLLFRIKRSRSRDSRDRDRSRRAGESSKHHKSMHRDRSRDRTSRDRSRERRGDRIVVNDSFNGGYYGDGDHQMGGGVGSTASSGISTSSSRYHRSRH